MRIPVPFQEYALPTLFAVIGLAMCMFTGIAPTFLLNELIMRIVFHGALVLALLPPLQAGMGFNFATGLGIWAAQAGFLAASAYGFSGASGSVITLVIGLLLAGVLGAGIGWLLSRMPGMEMLMTLFLLIPLSMFPLLMITKGLRALLPEPFPGPVSRYANDFVDLKPFNHSLTFRVQVGDFLIPLGPIVLIVLASFAVWAYLDSRYARQADDAEKQPSASTHKIIAFALSLMLACLSQSIILQGRPAVLPHSPLSRTLFPIVPAVIAGGALLHRAGLRHAFLGMFALNLVYIPLAEWFGGGFEIIQVIVSNGLILYALTRPDPITGLNGIQTSLSETLLSGSRIRR